MNTAIINRLKEGSVKNVILFGESKTITPPYVILKPETPEDENNDKQNFRISIHRNLGENAKCEAYIFTELPALFNNRTWLEMDGGCKFRLMNSGDWYGPLLSDEGNTVFYERIFFAPRRI